MQEFKSSSFFVHGVFASECGDYGDEWTPVPDVHEIVNVELKSKHRHDVTVSLSVINHNTWVLTLSPNITRPVH